MKYHLVSSEELVHILKNFRVVKSDLLYIESLFILDGLFKKTLIFTINLITFTFFYFCDHFGLFDFYSEQFSFFQVIPKVVITITLFYSFFLMISINQSYKQMKKRNMKVILSSHIDSYLRVFRTASEHKESGLYLNLKHRAYSYLTHYERVRESGVIDNYKSIIHPVYHKDIESIDHFYNERKNIDDFKQMRFFIGKHEEKQIKKSIKIPSYIISSPDFKTTMLC